MAAAVADFTPAAPAEGKLKKAGRERLELVLEPTADVLAGLGRARRDGQTLVGFAAEHGARGGRGRRAASSPPSASTRSSSTTSRAQDIGFDVDANEVTILTAARRPLGDRVPARAAGEQGGRSPRRSSTPSSGCAGSG